MSRASRAWCRRTAGTTLALSITAVVACGGDAPTGNADIAGTYTLRSIDGTLPFVVTDTQVDVNGDTSVTLTRVTAGSIALEPGDAFSEVLSGTVTVDDEPIEPFSVSQTGRYAVIDDVQLRLIALSGFYNGFPFPSSTFPDTTFADLGRGTIVFTTSDSLAGSGTTTIIFGK